MQSRAAPSAAVFYRSAWQYITSSYGSAAAPGAGGAGAQAGETLAAALN